MQTCKSTSQPYRRGTLEEPSRQSLVSRYNSTYKRVKISTIITGSRGRGIPKLFIFLCKSGGIGIHKGLKIPRPMGLWVRLPPFAPIILIKFFYGVIMIYRPKHLKRNKYLQYIKDIINSISNDLSEVVSKIDEYTDNIYNYVDVHTYKYRKWLVRNTIFYYIIITIQYECMLWAINTKLDAFNKVFNFNQIKQKILKTDLYSSFLYTT